MQAIQFYNSRARAIEAFEPLQANEVGIYTCGPTVYGYAHLGNLRSYLFADSLRRTLEYLGYATKHVMNITDVGHLTNDVDEGEDKVELAAKKEGKTAWEIASFYTDAFLEDTARLGILKPHILAKATAHIPEQIALIQTLEEKGYTYRIADGIYFDTSKFEGYGPMSGQSLDELQAGARVEANPDKRNPTDFALWKLSVRDGDTSEVVASATSSEVKEEHPHRQMEWESPWGVGFPGWHIECSAMSTKYLGQPFDIHTGGIDHLFPHHTDEIAQSEAAMDVPLANFWLHGEFMTVDGRKMAKSLGNTYTLQDAIDRGHQPAAFRYLMLGTHYRKPINFTWEALDGAAKSVQHLQSIARSLPAVSQEQTSEVPDTQTFDGTSSALDPALEEEFRIRIADDLGVPQALALLWEVLRSDRADEVKAAAIHQWDQVFGLGLMAELGQAESTEIPIEITALATQREAARQAGDFAAADALRTQLESAGYTVRDTSEGPELTPVSHPTEL